MKKTNVSKSKRIALGAILTSLALVLAIMENYLPISFLIPVPGIKLGLSNIVTVFAIVSLGPWDALSIIVIRCLVMGVITGPVAFAFSITGSIFAFLAMFFLKFGLGRIFSVIGISIGGAVAHNFGQVIVAVWLIKDTGLIYMYLPLLMIIGIFTGGVTGIAAIPVIKSQAKVLVKLSSGM